MKDSLAIVFWVAVVVLAYLYLPRGGEVVSDDAVSIITPVDMSQEAQDKMYATIMEYNKCMMQNRPEYHKQTVSTAAVAEKTLFACEPHLDELAIVLEENNVNAELRVGMVKTIRTRAVRKLMSMVMQSRAGQARAQDDARLTAESEAATAQ